MRLRQRIGEFVEWRCDSIVPSRILKWLRLCKVVGHFPVVDHCGMPKHDYCAACLETTPGQGRRR